MKALRGIIPKIEASGQCRKGSKDGSARDVNTIDPKEVNNLCLLYVCYSIVFPLLQTQPEGQIMVMLQLISWSFGPRKLNAEMLEIAM